MAKELDLVYRVCLCFLVSTIALGMTDKLDLLSFVIATITAVIVSTGFQFVVVHKHLRKQASGEEMRTYLEHSRRLSFNVAVIHTVLLPLFTFLTDVSDSFSVNALIASAFINLVIWSLWISGICAGRSFARHGLLGKTG